MAHGEILQKREGLPLANGFHSFYMIPVARGPQVMGVSPLTEGRGSGFAFLFPLFFRKGTNAVEVATGERLSRQWCRVKPTVRLKSAQQ